MKTQGNKICESYLLGLKRGEQSEVMDIIATKMVGLVGRLSFCPSNSLGAA